MPRKLFQIVGAMCGFGICLSSPARIRADDRDSIGTTMSRAYTAYKELQPYLSDAAAFEDPRNSQRVSRLVADLRDNFHTANSIGSEYHKEPGFTINLRLLLETLDDSLKRYREGAKPYAFWRLRRISQSCTSCHVTYNVALKFDDVTTKVAGLNQLQKADFYLATRQIDKAEIALQKALEEPTDVYSSIEIARKFLLLYTRVVPDPAKARDALRQAVSRLKLTKDQDQEIKGWLVSLELWATESTKETLSLAGIESLIRQGVKEDLFEYRVDAVSLLRATSGLHALLHGKTLTSQERSTALYLLGYSYNKLPLFFIDEFPELYLQQCIEEFPGTSDAVRSYKLYKEIILLGYSGSGGTHLPGDVAARLMELHDKAYGMLTIGGKDKTHR